MSQKDNLRKEKVNWNPRLQFLKQRKANLGISADPSLDIEIEDIEEKLKEFDKQLSGVEEEEPEPQQSSVSETSLKKSLLSSKYLLRWIVMIARALITTAGLCCILFVWFSNPFSPTKDISPIAQVPTLPWIQNNTPTAANTLTPVPTNTPFSPTLTPTQYNTPIPTNTSIPVPTNTSTSEPTAISVPFFHIDDVSQVFNDQDPQPKCFDIVVGVPKSIEEDINIARRRRPPDPLRYASC
jgi:hypothetical protein